MSPVGILLEIAAQRRRRLGDGVPRRRKAVALCPELSRLDNPFLKALAEPGRSIIAEVKLGSPRLGDLRSEVEPEALAMSYARAGAQALSVVVEPDFFFGSYELLERCRRASGLPTVAKDFLVHPSQLDAAVEAGASAILLIVALLGGDELTAWADAARRRGLVPLVETHSARDVGRLGAGGWEVVGVNNRDLSTFDVDLERAARLRPLLPAGCLAVAESGMTAPQDVERLENAGYDGFLIGEALVTASDPEALVRRLRGATPRVAP